MWKKSTSVTFLTTFSIFCTKCKCKCVRVLCVSWGSEGVGGPFKRAKKKAAAQLLPPLVEQVQTLVAAVSCQDRYFNSI